MVILFVAWLYRPFINHFVHFNVNAIFFSFPSSKLRLIFTTKILLYTCNDSGKLIGVISYIGYSLQSGQPLRFMVDPESRNNLLFLSVYL